MSTIQQRFGNTRQWRLPCFRQGLQTALASVRRKKRLLLCFQPLRNWAATWSGLEIQRLKNKTCQTSHFQNVGSFQNQQEDLAGPGPQFQTHQFKGKLNICISNKYPRPCYWLQDHILGSTALDGLDILETIHKKDTSKVLSGQCLHVISNHPKSTNILVNNIVTRK